MGVGIRKKSKFLSEHLLDAVNIPLNGLNNHLSEFPKDKPFVLYCAEGYKSMMAASMFKQRGWDNFTDVLGGFAGLTKTSLQKSNYICPTTML